MLHWQTLSGLLEMEEPHPEPRSLPELPLETWSSHNRPIADEVDRFDIQIKAWVDQILLQMNFIQVQLYLLH